MTFPKRASESQRTTTTFKYIGYDYAGDMERMRENRVGEAVLKIGVSTSLKTAEDEGIIRRELSKADPSAVVRLLPALVSALNLRRLGQTVKWTDRWILLNPE